VATSEEDLNRFVEAAHTEAASSEVLHSLRGLEIEDLVKVIPRLASTGTTGAYLEGLRDGAQALLSAKLTERAVTASTRLDQAINHLETSLTQAIQRFDRTSTLLAGTMVLLAIAQILVALLKR